MKKVFLVLFLTVLTTASLNVNATDKSVTMSEDALGEAIRSYLLENPAVMAEVFENTQKYLIAEDEKRQSEILKKTVMRFIMINEISALDVQMHQ